MRKETHVEMMMIMYINTNGWIDWMMPNDDDDEMMMMMIGVWWYAYTYSCTNCNRQQPQQQI